MGHEDLDPAPGRASSHRSRAVEFLDAHSVCWRVVERDARDDPGARAEWCLIFSCDEAVRRVWDYPAAWRDLSAEALTALSWGR